MAHLSPRVHSLPFSSCPQHNLVAAQRPTELQLPIPSPIWFCFADYRVASILHSSAASLSTAAFPLVDVRSSEDRLELTMSQLTHAR
jgi:hypothetical protein